MFANKFSVRIRQYTGISDRPTSASPIFPQFPKLYLNIVRFYVQTLYLRQWQCSVYERYMSLADSFPYLNITPAYRIYWMLYRKRNKHLNRNQILLSIFPNWMNKIYNNSIFSESSNFTVWCDIHPSHVLSNNLEIIYR